MLATESSGFSFHAPAESLPIVLEERSSQIYDPQPEVQGQRLLPVTQQHAPSKTLSKHNAAGAKRKRDEVPHFECLEGGGAARSQLREPELDSEDESSSDEEGDQKMPRLPSSSGTTTSTRNGDKDALGESSEGTLPILKSYHPDFISPVIAEDPDLDLAGGEAKWDSPIRQPLIEGKDDLLAPVQVMDTHMEVTSPPAEPVPGSQCLPGRKHDLSPPEIKDPEPTGETSSPFF